MFNHEINNVLKILNNEKDNLMKYNILIYFYIQYFICSIVVYS